MTAPATDDVRRGWRLFLVSRLGQLAAPFGYGSTPVGRKWARASCLTDPGVKQLESLGLHLASDPAPHIPPGDSCGCGFRVYEDLDAAARGARAMPGMHARQFAGRVELVLAGVEYRGNVAGTARFRLPGLDLTDRLLVRHLAQVPLIEVVDGQVQLRDERHTVRAESARVVGPVYVARDLFRSSVQSLQREYGRAAVVQLDERVFPALAGDRLRAKVVA